MRVALVNGGFVADKVGGSELQTSFLAQTLAEAGDQVHYIAVSSSRPDPVVERSSGFTVHRLDKRIPVRERESMLRTILVRERIGVCYVRILGWLEPVVRIAHDEGAGVVANLASDLDLIRRPVVGPFISGHPRAARGNARLNAGRAALRDCEHVVAQTNTQLDAAMRLGVTRASVIRNMFPDAPSVPRDPSREPEIVWVGSIKEVKRPEAFVRLAESLSGMPARFVMIGEIQDSAAGDRVQRAVERIPALEYMGVLPLDDAWARIAGASMLVNTSSAEGFANTLIQAWLAGVPTVTLGVDPDGLIASEGLGAVCSSEAGLAVEVRRLLLSEADRAAAGARARDYAVSEHALSASAPRYREVLLSAQGGRR